jgi:hypothetical protein
MSPVAAPETAAAGAPAPSRRHRLSLAWSAPVAWGAGLIAVALGAGAIVMPESVLGSVSGAVLVALGLAALWWGVVCLARGRVVAPRGTVAGALAGIGMLCAVLSLAPGRTSILAVAVCALLLVVTALTATAALRRGPDDRPAGVWGLLIAAVLVAAIATPALGSVQDALLARDDGTVPVLPAHHGG